MKAGRSTFGVVCSPFWAEFDGCVGVSRRERIGGSESAPVLRALRAGRPLHGVDHQVHAVQKSHKLLHGQGRRGRVEGAGGLRQDAGLVAEGRLDAAVSQALLDQRSEQTATPRNGIFKKVNVCRSF